jgi:hypothetical protein
VVGVPEIVIMFAAQDAVTPLGSPEGAPIPVARVVVWVMADKFWLIQTTPFGCGEVAVIFGVTVIVPVAATVPHPPVSGME